MDRREFLKISALFAASCMVGSCVTMSPRYTRPKALASSDELLLLSNCNILDVENKTIRPEKSMLIRGPKILNLFADNSPRNVAADRTLDLQGAYVSPGLINGHCHMTMPGAVSFDSKILFAYERQLERNSEECIKHGVTTVRDMLAVGPAFDALAAKIDRGQIVGPRIVSSCALDVDHGYSTRYIPYSKKERFWQELNHPKKAYRTVNRAFDAGADFIKLFQQPKSLLLPGDPLPIMDDKTITAVCNEAAKAGRPVALHHTESVGYNRALDGGVTTLEHMACDRALTETEILHLQKSSAYILPTASVAFALAYEMKGDPHWAQGMIPQLVKEREEIFPGLVREFAEPELVQGTLEFHKRLSDPKSYEKKHITPWPLPTQFTAAATVGTDNTKLLYDAGVKMGCGNDGGVPVIFPGAIYLEMTLLEELGFNPKEIMKMATINNARICNLDRFIGSVETGKVADLAVFEKNPFDTVRNAKTPKMVFQGGVLAYSS